MPTLRYSPGSNYRPDFSDVASTLGRTLTDPGVEISIVGNTEIAVFYVDDSESSYLADEGETFLNPNDVSVSLDFSDWQARAVLGGGRLGDILAGGAGDDRIEGNGGNDTLRGNFGINELFGGEGDDTIYGGTGQDTIDGGEGTDTVDYRDSAAGVEIDLLLGTGLGGDAEGDTYRSIESVFGSQKNDTIRGSGSLFEGLSGLSGDDVLVSRSDETFLDGGDGNDRIYVSQGAQYVLGGEGRDVLIFRAAEEPDALAATLLPNFNEPVGIETVVLTAGANVDLSGFSQSLGPITVRTGEAATTLTTTELATKVTVTGSGVFDLTTGRGGDTIGLTFFRDGSTIDAGDGFDTVNFSGGSKGPTEFTDDNFKGVEALTVDGARADLSGVSTGLAITIGRQNVYIVATSGDDTITTGRGSSINLGSTVTVNGGAGDDSINLRNTSETFVEGGAGRDRMVAGAGTDTFIYNTIEHMTGDKIFGFNGSDIQGSSDFGSDMFDLRGLEASLGRDLVFIGTDRFVVDSFDNATDTFQARTEVKANGDLSLQFDIDNDGRADASIFVRLANGAPALDQGDFVTDQPDTPTDGGGWKGFVAPHEPIHDSMLGLIA